METYSLPDRCREYYLVEITPGDVRLVETDYPSDYIVQPTPMPGSRDIPIWVQRLARDQYDRDLKLVTRFINQAAESINNGDPDREWIWGDPTHSEWFWPNSLDRVSLSYLEYAYGEREKGNAGEESFFGLDELPTDEKELNRLYRAAKDRKSEINNSPKLKNYYSDSPVEIFQRSPGLTLEIDNRHRRLIRH